MVVSIHQPNFVPWIGYFYKIKNSDVFVILDNVQFTKNGFTNRNKIKTPNGDLWLTMPVIQSGKFGQDITDCLIFNKDQVVKKTLASLHANYKKAPHFEPYFTKFSEILTNSTDNLCELNIQLIQWIMSELDIQTKTVRASELKNVTGENTERLVTICKQLNATKYLAGLGAKKYQDDGMFIENQIEIINTPFKYPTYTQLWGEFVGNLSVLDVMFNCGEETKQYLI